MAVDEAIAILLASAVAAKEQKGGMVFTPDIMKKIKRTLPLIMAAVLTCSSLPLVAQADSSKVVTLGANLTEEQKTSMYEYFGTSADEVDTIEVTNADERKYMEGIASEEQIGTRTYSCSYVEPTSSGGVQVKVANLTYVTSSMIASTLLTSGVENCNVVAASPIEVSGTGALTGIILIERSRAAPGIPDKNSGRRFLTDRRSEAFSVFLCLCICRNVSDTVKHHGRAVGVGFERVAA